MNGRMVRKNPEMNAAHDGRVLNSARFTPIAGKTYSLLVDNEIMGGLVEDLRCCILAIADHSVSQRRSPLARLFPTENCRKFARRASRNATPD